MSLRNLNLKQEYRSDRDDIVHEFFIRCLSNSTSYDRSIEYVSIKSLITLVLGSGSASDMHIRIVSSNHYRASDISILNKMLLDSKIDLKRDTQREDKLRILQSMIHDSRLEIKIAIPISDEIVGSFTERIGIFTDANKDVVAFTGTSNQTFDSQNHDFESIDVFTSWDDPSRVQTKQDNFKKLWENRTRYLSVCDFVDAESENLLKYSSSWAIALDA